MSTIFPHGTRVMANRRNLGKIVSKVPGADAARQRDTKDAYPRPMNDGRSPDTRANRRANAEPEVAASKRCHRLSYRYCKDFRHDLPGGIRVRPDIVRPRRPQSLLTAALGVSSLSMSASQ